MRYLRKVFRTLFVLVFFAGVVWLIVALDSFNDTGEGALSGAAYVSDGDTLRIADVRVRLLGIDAPELHQNCTRKNGDNWSCGQASRDLMLALVAGETVKCTGNSHDRYQRLLAHCTNGHVDLGGEMVRNGLALGEDDYLAEHIEARTNKRGMWSGDFITPRVWRDTHKGNADQSSGWIGDFLQSIFE